MFLSQFSVDVSLILEEYITTGHAIIQALHSGDNAIVTLGGATLISFYSISRLNKVLRQQLSAVYVNASTCRITCGHKKQDCICHFPWLASATQGDLLGHSL